MSTPFKTTGKTVTFTGDELLVYIPESYASYNCLTVEDNVVTLGIFDMIIDGKPNGMFLPAKITMEPSDVVRANREYGEFYELTFSKGDVFIKNRTVFRNPHLAYVVFNEMVQFSKCPKFLDYMDKAYILDIVQGLCGINFRSDHAIIELIFAHLHRDANDLTKPYRITEMKEPPTQIPMQAIAYATTSTMGKIVGSYFGDAINSALVNTNEAPSDVEDILRM